MSLSISNELKTQNKMLDNMEADVDEAQNQADLLTRKTKELIEKSGYNLTQLYSYNIF